MNAMAQADRSPRITPSILDRLFDNVPAEAQDPPPKAGQDLENFKAAVRRDLEALLNTRREALGDLSAYPQAQRSLLTYGLPDFTSLTGQSEEDRVRMRELIEKAIADFEPRLRNVTVTIGTREGAKHQLSFRVDALLRTDPVPAPVTFDAVLQLSTQQYQVKS
jgi:type VI secretion system protein ImpF